MGSCARAADGFSFGANVIRARRFKIFLPRIDVEEDALTQSVQHTELGGGETILVVEDQDGVRNFTSDVLCELGYRTCKARDGEEAIRPLTENPAIDLVVTATIMAGMTGPQLAASLPTAIPGIKVL